MNNLNVGFARVNINPMSKIGVGGYFKVRQAEDFKDNLEINAIAVKSGEKIVLMLSVDNLHITTKIIGIMKEAITVETGVPSDAIYIHSTHTHTSPYIDEKEVPADLGEEGVKLVSEYQSFFVKRAVDVSINAIKDLKPAKMGYATGKAPNVAFIRRYKMKDGTIKTNPGVNNPDIVAPVGETDDTVSVVRFDREGANSIAVVNFANHPDVVGGNTISADWPGFLRKTVEKVLDNVSCIFFNGAQGDVNHVNVHPTGGYLNDTFLDFDDVSRGYKHSEYIGRVVTGGVLQAWDKVKYVDVDSVNYVQKTVCLPSNMPDPSQVAEAHRINDLHKAGKDDEIGYTGMMLTTVVAEAGRMVRLENGPESFPMTFSAISIGEVAFFGIPGEPFNLIGREIKKAEGWGMVIPSCLTNGAEGYFPMKDSYDEGGYEARSSRFKAGVAELIIEEGLNILSEIKK